MPSEEQFAGEKYRYPEKGDFVYVLSGRDIGEALVVERIGGFAFSNAYKIYVYSKQGSLVWYWPWNLEVLPKKEPHEK